MNWPMIHELAEAERPRERLQRGGPGALSDAELLGLIMGSGCEGVSAVELARRLLQEVGGDLGRLAALSHAQLCHTRGIGPAKASALLAVFELARRLGKAERPLALDLSSPADVARLLLQSLGTLDQEEFHIFLLDSRNRLVHAQMISRGTLDRTSLHPREIFRHAVRFNCARLIVGHNHPSGDPNPSPQDLQITRALKDAGELMGMALLDHVIVGSATLAGRPVWRSLREDGHL